MLRRRNRLISDMENVLVVWIDQSIQLIPLKTKLNPEQVPVSLQSCEG